MYVSGQFKKKKPLFTFETTEDLLLFVKSRFLDNMLSSVKKGNSNESISDGIFDRIGFSTKVLREDDYGIDYLCSVGKEYGCSIHPTKTFVAQLKSNFNSVVYDLSKNGKNNWLIENNIPLFFCVYVESTGLLYFYSSSMINDFNIRRYKNVNKITFTFREPNEDLCEVGIHRALSGDEEIYEIDCGVPFLKISVLETNDDHGAEFDNYRGILEKVINKDNENIVYRNLGLPFMTWLHQYKMNDKDIAFGWADYSDDKLISGKELLNQLYQPVITLCKTYYHENDTDKYQKLKTLVDSIDCNDRTRSVLQGMGFRDSNDNII